MKKSEIYKRLWNDYSKIYLNKIFLLFFFSILVAGSTSSIAWLLDPAIKKLFIEKDQTLIFLIPLLIILAFTTKGLSLYFAKSIMIGVGEAIKKKLQYDMINTLIGTDTQIIDKKHSGKFISNLTYDVIYYKFIKYSCIVIIQRLSNFNRIISCNVFSKLETSININCNDTACKYFSKNSR